MLKYLGRRNVLFPGIGNNGGIVCFSTVVPKTMKAWCLHEYGEDTLTLEDMDVPSKLKPNEVLVQVNAASLNPIDSLMRKGFGSVLVNSLRKWNKVNEFPVILGRDFSGVVVKKGKMVSRVQEGDEVWGTPAVWRPGTFAEYCCVPQDELSVKPKKLTHIEAASFPYVLSTVWSALCDSGGVTESNAKNKRLFIVGGSGGIGTLAIQLMKAWGAHVTSTCSNDAIELLQRIGADEVIDYKNEDLADRIRNEPRFDVILDTVGGNIDLFSGSRACKKSVYIHLNPPLLDDIDNSGFVFGLLKSGREFLVLSLYQRIYSNIDYKWGFFQPNAAALNCLEKIVSNGEAVPVIDSVFEFHDLPNAFKRLNHGHLRGKLVLKVNTP